METLIIDIGNTFTKFARFAEGRALSVERAPSGDLSMAARICQENPISSIVLASVGADEEQFVEELSVFAPVHAIKSTASTPISSSYQTPLTLGVDRLANSVAAFQQAQGKPALAIDTGTCLTYDLVGADGLHLGGAISPGIRLRATAMNDYSARLPLVIPEAEPPVLGKDTYESLASGIFHGIINEIEGFVSHYQNEYPNLYVVITGGDAFNFQRALKCAIFADPLLTLKGFYAIHQHE